MSSLKKENIIFDVRSVSTLNAGENLQDDLTHGLWCTKCGFKGRIGESGQKAFFVHKGESLCKKHYEISK